ncbi:type ISP restriction/modification enzyme [Secundilactobacillus mixtipabuli]|uniref:Helicase n=1 Tax=Secundilactobacillus mixtipabuli TaxID=1435342 RepID=A0A1Z5I9A1_9LACO|nr:type ISP restriction/modification enzyme [Secundilactobacillus mixtipabuli]GAW98314.1 helicase [Secundilactobacillus mixtipabuli]
MDKFDELIEQIDDAGNNIQRDRGTMFEKVVKSFLLNEPVYKNRFDAVWMLAEVPEKYGIPKKDLGVDIVAHDKQTGKLTAVQAKYYQEKVGKGTLNSFLAELGKNYYADGILVSTTDEWNENAEAAFRNLSKPVSILGLSDLKHAAFDWTQFSFNKPQVKIKVNKKQPRDYQVEAIQKALDYFADHERGKLIMAPGTGKTFTSLKIAEALMQQNKARNYKVLYLVPSIQLLSQTLFSWNNDVSDDIELVSFAVTSDRSASKRKTFNNNDEEDLNVEDIGFPATTDAEKLVNNYENLHVNANQLTVVFSTYQSIEVLHQAQEKGFPEFDLIIADEAHRTVGAHALKDKTGMFMKVHSNDVVKSKRRLYQTATPKIYSEDTKKKAVQDSIVIASMDDKTVFGDEIYRLGFGDAVARGILTDYKVEVLAVDASVIHKDMQSSIATENGIGINDIGKIIGVWNAMMKRKSFSNKVDGYPMRRAIAFASVIDKQRSKNRPKAVGSKQITKEFNRVVNEYLGNENPNKFDVEVRHVDGSMNALKKKSEIDWLASDFPDNEARVLSNVKFLTEGIDVPNLDAIIFFAAKKSQIDIVQAVGRIMRKAPDKAYGYIILPIVVPLGESPENVLDNNDEYQAVWQVLNALRSIDERFEATVNKLDLNKQKPHDLNVIGVGKAPNGELKFDNSKNDDLRAFRDPDAVDVVNTTETELQMNWHAIQDAIYGRIVRKVGDRRYLEDWSKDVQKLAERHIRWIEDLINDKRTRFAKTFDKFLSSLQYNINSDIDQRQAIEMLAQHIITKPIFEALFDQYNFVNDNPVSKAMENMIDLMVEAGFDQEQKALEPFYESVRLRARGIDNSAGKQEFIKTLYNNFFTAGFSETTERLGVVFTPVGIVDFIVKSVDEVLNKYFGRGLADENVHVLDPFTGTGTFITRTLQYLADEMRRGEITLADITRKYTQELHANEIILLSYYIAAVNIEAVFDEINGSEKYVPFSGIVLTDTFETTENFEKWGDDLFNKNNKRLLRQQEIPIDVIISNPPYSGDQNNKSYIDNLHYENLERRVNDTYRKTSTAVSSIGLNDSYIKAFRWASDRLGKNGIIGFITNSGFIDKNAMDGVRGAMYGEFNYLYIINLRGSIRGRKGDLAKKEGGNVFDILAGVAISILVKDGSNNHHIFYKDVGDYKTKSEKFKLLTDSKSIFGMKFTEVQPNENNDWVGQRDNIYQGFYPIATKKNSVGIFPQNALGVNTNRDSWVYGFSKESTLQHAKLLIDHYNSELERVRDIDPEKRKMFLSRDSTYIKWSDGLKQRIKRGEKIEFDPTKLVLSLYRPFTKRWLYYDELVIERKRIYYDQFGKENSVIFTSGRGARNLFSALATDLIPNMDCLEKSQGFMRFNNSGDGGLLGGGTDNLSKSFSNHLGMTTDEAYYYVYGVMNSPEYKERYRNELVKDLARIPILMHADKYAEIGEKLFKLHVNYESSEIYKGCKIVYHTLNPNFAVNNKMTFGKNNDKSIIKFNPDITIEGIPLRTYDYILDGRSAVEWIMDQYKVSTDTPSQITDDPNDYSDDPKYIFNLLLRVISVSLKTLDLVEQLPKFELAE